MTTLNVNDLAPEFRAEAVGGEFGEGREIALSDLRGTPVVIYFYPKDDTPGCTAQACGLRDVWSNISAHAKIFGISPDNAKSHTKFISKFALPFPLIADPYHEIVTAYGVWVEKSMYGKKYMGAERTTFVIDADGHICTILRKVKPEQHVELVTKALAALAGSR